MRSQNGLRLAVLLSCFMEFGAPRAQATEHCAEPVATAVSIEGIVEARRPSTDGWFPLTPNASLCAGDRIKVGENSRAALSLANETLMRLDRLTTVTLTQIERQSNSFLDLLRGAAHFISRVPKNLTVTTPFVNGGVEGTEFVVRTDDQGTLITVFEGQVLAENRWGQVQLTSNQSALAAPASAPMIQLLAKPRDAVEWTLRFPLQATIPSERLTALSATEQTRLARSTQLAGSGNPSAALAELHTLSSTTQSAFVNYHASLLLAVGRTRDALKLLNAPDLDPADQGDAYALSAVAALVSNEPELAAQRVEQALQLSPQSVNSHLAHSLLMQAQFDIPAAERAARQALNLEPKSADAQLRVAELLLMQGDLAEARTLIAKARQQTNTPPGSLAHAATLAGFALLLDGKPKPATTEFNQAIAHDSAAPLPRLGLALSQIRQGQLSTGRKQLEIAAILEPNRALLRSYLARAYAEEQRINLAQEELAMAKRLDPMDPTPWLYEAMLYAEQHRPIEALASLQQSMAKNNHRAVYRSRLLLDQDQATRLGDQAQIYRALGFERLALLGSTRAIEQDPGNYSALRSLAASLISEPRSEIARVSALLQAQLLQPANAKPASESLSQADLGPLQGSGSHAATFNDYAGLFEADRLHLYGSGLVGSNDSNGAEITLAGVGSGVAVHARRFHYQSDGFRPNHQRERTSHTLFTQADFGHDSSLQLEIRQQQQQSGDLALRFDPDNYSPVKTSTSTTDSVRLGGRQQLNNHLQLLATLTQQNIDNDQNDQAPGLIINSQHEQRGTAAELQLLYRSPEVNLQIGYRKLSAKETFLINQNISFPCPPIVCEFNLQQLTEQRIKQQSAYLYAQRQFNQHIGLTLGANYAEYDSDSQGKATGFSPKLGASLALSPQGTLRLATFKTQRQKLIGEQALEPVAVAGFNQFYDDLEITQAKAKAIAYDHRFNSRFSGGFAYLQRDLNVPTKDISGTRTYHPWQERIFSGYLYWLPNQRFALSARLDQDRFARPQSNVGEENILDLKTHRLRFIAGYFHPSGVNGQLAATYVRQQGEFFDPTSSVTGEADDDRFWTLDASLKIPLAQRRLSLTLEGRNLANTAFNYQEMDPRNPSLQPQRTLFAKLILAF